MNKNSFLLPLRHTVFLILLILKYILKLQYRAGNGAGVKITTKVWKLNNFCCAHRRRMKTEDKAKSSRRFGQQNLLNSLPRQLLSLCRFEKTVQFIRFFQIDRLNLTVSSKQTEAKQPVGASYRTNFAPLTTFALPSVSILLLCILLRSSSYYSSLSSSSIYSSTRTYFKKVKTK